MAKPSDPSQPDPSLEAIKVQARLDASRQALARANNRLKTNAALVLALRSEAPDIEDDFRLNAEADLELAEESLEKAHQQLRSIEAQIEALGLDDTDFLTRRFQALVREMKRERGGARGWQKAVASELGVSPSYLTRIMGGKKRVGWTIAAQACEKSGIPLSYFRVQRGEPEPDPSIFLRDRTDLSSVAHPPESPASASLSLAEVYRAATVLLFAVDAKACCPEHVAAFLKVFDGLSWLQKRREYDSTQRVSAAVNLASAIVGEVETLRHTNSQDR